MALSALPMLPGILLGQNGTNSMSSSSSHRLDGQALEEPFLLSVKTKIQMVSSIVFFKISSMTKKNSEDSTAIPGICSSRLVRRTQALSSEGLAPPGIVEPVRSLALTTEPGSRPVLSSTKVLSSELLCSGLQRSLWPSRLSSSPGLCS